MDKKKLVLRFLKYAEKQPWSEHIRWHEGIVEKGYNDDDVPAILGNWNMVPDKIVNWLENYAHVLWYDEWSYCSDCYKAFLIYPNCLYWKPSYIQSIDGEYVCYNCFSGDLDELDYYINNPDQELPEWCIAALKENGYKRLSIPEHIWCRYAAYKKYKNRYDMFFLGMERLKPIVYFRRQKDKEDIWYQKKVDEKLKDKYYKEIKEDFRPEKLDFEKVTSEDGFEYLSAYVGSCFSIFPSGKFYTPWTSNQTTRDVWRDRAYGEALEAVLEENGLWYTNGEDIFICKRLDDGV